ncbi:predicted protein [Naegleria gruberi]|uniref:Predicted protein n=1 Tax=Naegleria gruberi TaxID=5762 RepID=D2VBV2_NAEGR|nr:uncharacterized protein NAEGRDRAFT_48287 [Naegleria gruberi]EFC45536.1 predicted protein [Naegleria gruberi]|eukprot:XP_002678280.1 predicted protein [Naegleria gruberi strain NEG-M]
MFSGSKLRFLCRRLHQHQHHQMMESNFHHQHQQTMLLLRKSMVMNKPLYNYSTSTITANEATTTESTPTTTTNTPTTATTTSTTTNSNTMKYTSTEIRLIKKQKERVLKKEKIDEVVGKLFNINQKKEMGQFSENVVDVVSETPAVEKKKRKSKKAEAKEAASKAIVEEPIKKEAFTNPEIDSLVDNILTMTIAGQASLAASAEEEDELISLLKTKRRQRFNTLNSNNGVNVGPTTYKSSIDKFSQQEVDFKQYTQTKESELSSPLEMSEEGDEDIKTPQIDPEDEDILSYLRELKDRTVKQKEEEKKSALENDNELDEEDKIVEKAWQDIASKPESAAKTVEAELDEPVSRSSKSSSNNSKKDDVIMQFLQDLLK